MSTRNTAIDTALPQAVDDCHKVLVWLVPMLDHFPRSRRYTLGSKMENEMLEVLESLLNATYSSSSQRKGALQRANRKLAVSRHLLRLALELKLCSPGLYRHGAGLMVELGRQIGGWQKAVQ